MKWSPNPDVWNAFDDFDSDMLQNPSKVQPDYLGGTFTVPVSDGDWSGGYQRIRRCNIMLDNLDGADVTETERAHLRAVALFFRAQEYFKLIRKFGGVPWIEHALTENDTDILYGPRDSRETVASNILRDLLEAVENINEEGDGADTVNKDVVKAFISRFGLFEGTWRKYHNLGGEQKYLETCIKYSEELIKDHPTLHPSYDQIYNSEDLADVPGVLLYTHYVKDKLPHVIENATRSAANTIDLTKKAVDKFLTKNGMSVRNPNNNQFQGDKDAYAEFRDRDTRLLIMTPPPYKIIGDSNFGLDNWQFTDDPADREYFSILENITGGYPQKTLPDRNWNERITGQVPNYVGSFPERTINGYRFWKIFNEHLTRIAQDISDWATFRMGEVMLNYAEAMFEMGNFDQTVADMTINKLRARGEVAPMQVNQIGPSFDPTRDPDVDPVLFEIRRERAVELMGDGFRTLDLRRWKKMDYATADKLGRWEEQSDWPTINLPIQNNAAEGYLQVIPNSAPKFPDYYYLYPIPSDEIVLNPALEQNPGW